MKLRRYQVSVLPADFRRAASSPALISNRTPVASVTSALRRDLPFYQRAGESRLATCQLWLQRVRTGQFEETDAIFDSVAAWLVVPFF